MMLLTLLKEGPTFFLLEKSAAAALNSKLKSTN